MATPKPDSNPPSSPNFGFLSAHHALLVRYAAQAERFVFEDANLALIRLRQFAEILAHQVAASSGTSIGEHDDFAIVLNRLRDRRLLAPDVLDLFHGLRKTGNEAVHHHTGTRGEALHQLRMARLLAVWFHRAFGNDPKFSPGPFVPPPDPAKASQELLDELHRLRTQLIEKETAATQASQSVAEQAKLREKAETEAKRAYDDLAAALSLAEESEGKLAAARVEFEKELTAIQAAFAAEPTAKVEEVVSKAQQAATLLDLDEAATRKIIDQQLRDAGWEVDSESLNYAKGSRPQKGKNLAIAEWPTKSGPSDYVLFHDLTPLAVVEAKKSIKDIPGSIEQSKRYSRTYSATADELSPGGPWGVYKIPFLFATNGRAFLQQLRTKSGIWFLDARFATNQSRPLEGWYSPDGLATLLKQDTPAADERLKEEPKDYLPLRDYQGTAVEAIEEAIAEGNRQILVAMATGTGKTITCICLAYRLIKAKRFRRILFLVDRTALGEQTGDAFKDVKLENFQTFNDIYDVKELGDIVPAPDTRLHIATVQGMVKRILFPDEGTPPLPVDLYDAIVVDECHRGYSLDREMSDAELTFRDEQDYISKYRRVLEHFDAVKIGLTATPALHTVEIFGTPIYTYSYRKAVIDGWLVDHEPPINLVTALAEAGIKWKRGEVIKSYVPRTGTIDATIAPDDVNIEVEQFNKLVITENFNRVVCKELADDIDPSLPGKTVIFCATDSHADMVVDLLKKALAAKYGEVEDSAVVKITAAADKPLQLIRRFKNERLPKIAVTVDLLTTGIDVPEIVNIVFIRRVRSRILYDQMLGRGTRLCKDIEGSGEQKQVFRIFDTVDLYSTLSSHTDMKPVVVNPTITFEQLASELDAVPNQAILKTVAEQFVAKFRRKQGIVAEHHADAFKTLTGTDVGSFAQQVGSWKPEQLRDWLVKHPGTAAFLDNAKDLDQSILISEHEDALIRRDRGYGKAKKPEDYLESFKSFVIGNLDRIPALLIVTQRPKDLTRQQLKELKLALDEAGFSEANIRTAYRETTNQDFAATIIGYIRHVANGSPLLSYGDRVAKAMQKILASGPWTTPQRKWLERIGKQLEVETIVDHEALEHGQFKAEGGFARLNKVFDGKLDEILKDIADAMWQSAA